MRRAYDYWQDQPGCYSYLPNSTTNLHNHILLLQNTHLPNKISRYASHNNGCRHKNNWLAESHLRQINTISILLKTVPIHKRVFHSFDWWLSKHVCFILNKNENKLHIDIFHLNKRHHIETPYTKALLSFHFSPTYLRTTTWLLIN